MARTSPDDISVFGMEMNTSRPVATSLLQAGLKRVESMRQTEGPSPRAELQ